MSVLFAVSSIVVLLPLRCPTAIRGGVISVVINSVDRVSRGWSFTHVIIKRLKTISPLLANGYVPFPVSEIIAVIMVMASLYHANPYLIFFLFAWKDSLAMATGCSSATREISGSYVFLKATKAFTQPNWFTFFRDKVLYFKSPKSLTRKINYVLATAREFISGSIYLTFGDVFHVTTGALAEKIRMFFSCAKESDYFTKPYFFSNYVY